MKIFVSKKICFLAAIIFLSFSLFCSFPVKSELKITTGKIVHREIYTSGGLGSSTRYHILVKYIYEVSGKEYESSKIGYMRFFYSTKESAEKSIESYQLDKPVTVYYSPADPKESYLEVDD